mgnify:CR=1 FL=1
MRPRKSKGAGVASDSLLFRLRRMGLCLARYGASPVTAEHQRRVDAAEPESVGQNMIDLGRACAIGKQIKSAILVLTGNIGLQFT